MRISILLPYKENFSPDYPGAVSIFVKDTALFSKYKKHITVYGSTTYKKKLLKNYVNLPFFKGLFESSSKKYVESFIESEKKINSDIIEVHNRPNYIKNIKKKYNNRLILYFHNDPLSMSGSKTVSERLYLLNNIDNIIFNSNWSKKRFFIDLPINKYLSEKTSICYQSAPSTKIDFKKKKKIISFIGKLNTAKGYDLFGTVIEKILDKYPEWKAIVIGDERREKLLFHHKNLNITGFKSNEFILNYLKKVSISVICSRWDEPFGRASLEAASRGSAVVISKRGGLPETSKNAIILKSLTEYELFKSIEKLINNEKYLRNLQKKNFLNFKFNHRYITDIIDNIRKKFVNHTINKFNIKKQSIYKILHITNFNDRFNGRLHYNTGRRINNGFIRLGHNVLSISDRDIINKNKTFIDPKGSITLQNTIIESFNNFNPDVIVLGHADAVSINTLDLLKNKKKNLKFAQWFLDPLGRFGPDHNKNKTRILDKEPLMDSTFLTTDPKSLSININNSHFMPNPCDHSFEILNNFKNDCYYDVFFAMSHGVHRGALKKGKTDDREIYINKLLKKNKNLKFDIYGMNKVQPIWGEDFMKNLSNSAMGLNLSRGKPIKYYSSDRIAQLLGNGLLTFVDKKTFLNDFFNEDEIIFYNNMDDLSYKLNKYKKDYKTRKKIAYNGKNKYFKYFNSTIISDFILSKTVGYKSKKKFIWVK